MLLIQTILILLTIYSTNGQNRLIIKNNCGFTVWPGIFGRKYLPENGGFRLNPGQTKNIDNLPTGWEGRVWPRTNCNSNGKCQTGDCDGKIQCSGKTARATTLAEIKFQGSSNLNNYDISLVDGFNVPTSMRPTPGTFQPQKGVKNSCTKGECLNNKVLSECPKDLQSPGTCKSACERYETDEYCCRNQFNSPEKCKGAKINRHFKDRCPKAYSYAYDDANDSLLTCPASKLNSFDITFCG